MSAASSPQPSAAPAAGQRSSRAGRNLPAAIGVGLTLAGALLATLLAYRPLFVALVAAAVVVGLWEVVRALRRVGADAPYAPLAVGAVLMIVGAYRNGAEALALGLMFTVAAGLVWVLPREPTVLIRDLSATVLASVWVPFLAGFAVLLAAPADDGGLRAITFLLTTTFSDIGGYAAGVLFGRHPLAPSVSPKKSWEGFGGSAVACVGIGIATFTGFFGAPAWQGAVFGLAMVAVATLGDLGESLVKRDLAIKDMGSLLPGHGGLMDRLDSLLPAAPVAWLLLTYFAPPG